MAPKGLRPERVTLQHQSMATQLVVSCQLLEETVSFQKSQVGLCDQDTMIGNDLCGLTHPCTKSLF